MKTVFRVTPRDIAQAPTTGVCPVAAAMSRRLDKPVVLGHRFATVGRRRYVLPEDVTSRIQRWDKRGTMAPFQFSMELAG